MFIKKSELGFFVVPKTIEELDARLERLAKERLLLAINPAASHCVKAPYGKKEICVAAMRIKVEQRTLIEMKKEAFESIDSKPKY